MNPLLVILVALVGAGCAQPLLFPHGWFESKNLRPRDAIILNMMAQSNLEYGGVTLEELDKLDAVRKQLPRPETLARDREEDDKSDDRKPIFTSEGEKIETEKPKEKTVEEPSDAKDGKKKTPFRRVELKLHKKRETEAAESDNPFEEIATRSPPKDWLSMRQLRNRNRKNKKKRRRFRKNGFLTREDIIKPQKPSEQSSVKLSDRSLDKAEFDEKLRNRPQETWDRENKAAEQVREEMARGSKQKAEEPESPAMKMLAKEHEDLDRRIAIAEQSGARKTDRLPNNPYTNLDLSKPTVISLPLPPLEMLKEVEDS